MSSPQIVDLAAMSQHGLQPDTRPEITFDNVRIDPADDMKKPEYNPADNDAFGNEEFAEVKYKVLKWWCVYCRFVRCRCSTTCIGADADNALFFLGNAVFSWLPKPCPWASCHSQLLSQA